MKLLPCPHCGGKAKFTELETLASSRITLNVVKCTACNSLCLSPESWNARTPTQRDLRSPLVNCDGLLNKGHFHELIDRAHIICSMLDDYVIGHPGMTQEMNEKCVDAQASLSEMQSMASALEAEIFGKGE